MFLSYVNLPELKCQPGWFILSYDRPYYSDDSSIAIELCQSFDRLIGFHKKTGYYFDARYEGDEYNQGGRINGIFSVTFQRFNFDINTSGYGDSTSTEKLKTDSIREFSRLLNDFVERAEQQ
ncbi:hypothetical protein [Xenorhabdus bovienii]|uniref:Uncharacterized protein n=1 Tax=Xenorhabdus bovienii str. Intermedium TaxID=1379677 RepID=A0A077QP54_XENBV|nr:hypothetical protein [Xenorhabdus bovienii]CDH34031.1 hypothetical protein XBI1_2850011 [Xenorhabdus bovienii str. Intermedium]